MDALMVLFYEMGKSKICSTGKKESGQSLFSGIETFADLIGN